MICLQLDDPGKTVATPAESHRLPDSAGADPCGIKVAGHTHFIGIFIMAILGKATLLFGGLKVDEAL
jgi:hypothetical protein